MHRILHMMRIYVIDRCLYALVLALAIALAAHPVTAEESQSNEASSEQNRRCKGAAVNLNFVDAELIDVIAFISKTTGRRFIVSGSPPPVKITVFSPRPVCPDEAYQAFLSALAVNGLTVVKRGRFWEIVTAERAVKSSIPIVLER